MKLEPKITLEAIRRRLDAAAGEIYGDDRAAGLSEQLDHLAAMMQTVVQQPLEIPEAPLPTPPRRDRSCS